MKQNAFTVTEKTLLSVRTHGNLRIMGWDRMEVAVDSDDDQMRAEQAPDLLRVICLDDCEIFAPVGIKVLVEKAGGDMRAANFTGDLEIEKVGGNLTLQTVGKVQARRVGGNCRLNSASGAAAFEKIGGTVDALDLEGGLRADSIGGDLTAAGVKVGLSARAGGNINAALNDLGTDDMNLRAGGDINLELPSSVTGSFELICGGEDIRIHLDQRVENVEQREYQFTIGQSSQRFAMRAGGCIYISDQPLEPKTGSTQDRFGWEERLSQRIQDRVRAAQRNSDWAERVERMTEEAIRRAEERVNAAMERVEASGRAGWHSSAGFVVSPPTPPTPPTPPAPAASPFTTSPEPVDAAEPAKSGEPVQAAGVSDEERLLILRMLQEKKITVEQAEELMEALESGSVPDEQD